MNMPPTNDKVCVVIPAHSYPEYLPEALRSVLLDQTVQVGSIIVVLDGPEKVKEYGEIIAVWNEDVSFLNLPFNLGVSNARNVGFSLALQQGYEWIIPLDEDDLLNERYVERMTQAAEWCPDVKVFYPDWAEFSDNGVTAAYHKVPEYSFARLVQAPFIISTAFIHVDVWKAVQGGYDTELTKEGLRWEDYLFYLEAALLGFDFARVGLGLVRVRRHGASGTTIANATTQEWYEYAEQKLERLYSWQFSFPRRNRDFSG